MTYHQRLDDARAARRGVTLSALPVASQRDRLPQLARERGTTLTALSRLVGRSDGYVGRFVAGGPPEQLRPAELDLIERFLGSLDRG